MKISNIDSDWQAQTNQRGALWKHRDLSGENLGVRLEVLAPGETSSERHYHTAEEEHLIMLEVSSTLIFGPEQHTLNSGDHVRFKAGDEMLAVHSCRTCGCTTHWESLVEGGEQMAVNFRMCELTERDQFTIRKLDGADTWEFLD